MTAITFALREESRDFARLMRHAGEMGTAPHQAILGNVGEHEVLLFHTGVGETRAGERVAQLLDQHRISRLVSAGFAGGLDPELPAGALFLATNHSAPDLLGEAQAILGGRAHSGVLASVPTILETPEEKALFARASGARAVDMETATLGALCHRCGVPMLSLRVISDTAGEELAVPFSVCFDSATERPRPMALLQFLLHHPTRTRRFLHFVMRTNHARQTLTAALVALLRALPPAGTGNR